MVFFWPRMMRSSMGLRPAKPSLVLCQWRDSLLAELPAQQDDFVADDAGKIEQADVEVFDLHSGGVDLSDGVLGALDRLLALVLAGLERADVDVSAAIQEDPALEGLEFGVHFLDQRLGLHGGAQ